MTEIHIRFIILAPDGKILARRNNNQHFERWELPSENIFWTVLACLNLIRFFI